MVNVDELIKNSMKEKKADELKAYKNLKAEILNFKTAKNAKPYDEAAEIQLISKMCKKLGDAAEEFKTAGRDDLSNEYLTEKSILEKFLPKAATKEDIEFALQEQFGNNIEKKDFGQAMKYIRSKFPMSDGKVLSEIIKSHTI
jgi:uncharacterized protein YqeY